MDALVHARDQLDLRVDRYETDCFYDVHSAEITSKGTLLLFDDGNNRNHCSADDGTTNATGCFSRAIEYSLDFREQTVTVVWQFEWEKLYGGEGSLVGRARRDRHADDGEVERRGRRQRRRQHAVLRGGDDFAAAAAVVIGA